MTLSTKKTMNLLVLVLLIPLLSFAEEVCKISYKDYPANLKDKVIEAPANTVSLSEAVQIKKADDDSVVIMNTPAIMFVLDNSGSMYVPHRSNSDTVQYNLALDPEGNRFSVTEAMIDSLYIQDPNAEVGLVVFGSDLHFDKTDVVTKYIDPDDPLNFADPAFVTFLQLNKEYTEDNKTWTGYQFLKYYLETEELSDRIVFKDEDDTSKVILDTVVYFTMLKNITRMAIDFHSGTDITLAFEAVKEGLNHTEIEKHLQYTVFFSDGMPNSGMKMWDFVKGQGIPTTYTVFFHPDKIAPDSLISMNKNIKNNDYSSNNINSDLWAFDNSGHEELLEFMIENVLNKIKGEITTEPVEITINGKTNGTWVDGIFTFEDQFPLVAEKSDFNFDIRYNIITKKSDNTTTIDTVHDTVDFSVQREASPTLLDSVTVERWDRSITVSDKDSVISIIAEGTEELEILFTEKKVDCNYQYEDVEVMIKSVNFGDELILPLNKKDAHNFSKKFSLDFKEEGDPKDDDQLQLSPDDEISIFFQNKKLPLDTMTVTVATNIVYRVRFQQATYFDENGDGSVDKITMPFQANFEVKDSHVKDIVSAIELPLYRKLTVDEAQIRESVLHLEVSEGLGRLETAVHSDDVVTISAKDIDFFEVSKGELTVVDSMAPVLDVQTVSVVENVSGATFSVRFTEPVTEITSTTPLTFYDKNSDSYSVELSVEEAGEREYTFLVTSSDKNIESGDSVHITFSDVHVSDLQGNSQLISTNVKRRVSTSAIVDIDKAAYFDRNADGSVDRVKLFYSSLQPLSDADAKELFEKAVRFPSFRKFTVENIAVKGAHVEFDVTEGLEEVQTYCSEEDVIKISEQEINDLFIATKSLAVIDSVAPVLMDKKVKMTRFTDRATLIVTFSEELEEIDSEEPLSFYHGEESYKMLLMEKSGETVVYEFSVTENAKEAESGDSVQISIAASLTDLAGNSQRNAGNIKREMVVSEELSFKNATYFDRDADGHVDCISVDYELMSGSLNIDIKQLLDVFILPSHRELKIDRDAVTLKESTLIIPVEEKVEAINTACTKEDVFIINGGTFGNYFIDDDTLPIVDSMAPVISTDPVLYLNTMSDDTPDSLRLTFSEEVESIEHDTPLRFFHNGDSFLGNLEVVAHDNKGFLFSILSFDSAVEELYAGDSVNIHEAVFDIEGNEQDNPKNIKRALDVKIILPEIGFDLRAITPFIPGKTLVPDEIISLVADIEQYKLSQNDSGYVGDPIMLLVTPESILDQLEFTIEAEIAILDKVGNVVMPLQEMEYLDDLNALVYLWNGKNSFKRIVGKDGFLLVCQAKLTFADGQTFEVRKELILATQEEDE